MVSAGGRVYCFFGIQGASPPLTVTGIAWFYRHPERQRRIPKPAVILSEAKDPVFCGFGVLFTGFFVAVLLRMTGREKETVILSGAKDPVKRTGSL